MTTFRLSPSVGRTLALAATLLLTGSAFAETVIYSFCAQASCADGSEPSSGLTRGKDGVLYGVTYFGGQYGWGTVFELTPPGESGGAWTETVLYSFKGVTGDVNDGYYPEGPVILDKSGNLYGTTFYGGPNFAGCVFELTPPTTAGGSWTETIIYGFARFGAKGAGPAGALTFGWEGSLYGTTQLGGAHGGGTVFRTAQEKTGRWIGNVVYSFPVSGGYAASPVTGVIPDKAGNLYGTTLLGGGDGCSGGSGCGTVFEVSPPSSPGTGWTETTLHSFTDENGDGAAPLAPVAFDGAGNLYGATLEGGQAGNGTVFELSPNPGGGWTETILYSFTGGDDGSDPEGSLVLDAAGNLYGTAGRGGRVAHGCPSNGCGTVFELSPPSTEGGAWTETTVHEFKTGYEASVDGIGPNGSLVFGLYGSLYGTTAGGGAYGQGAVFSVHP